MRVLLTFGACLLAVLAAACGGSTRTSSTPTPVTLPGANAGSPTGAVSPVASAAPATAPAAAATTTASTPAGASVQVTGIVGSVSTATGFIEIDRLSGAAVRRISVGASTVLRRAGGGTTTLAQLRPSQRIIAEGTLNDRGDTLVASQVTVQDVVPGVQPGG
ncbi:MAG TPA: hypothetical protein VEZ14_02140 [Dehalococcoidia bacterium]|nr:hypothetical protein [Dehalococcoidia bacterium]